MSLGRASAKARTHVPDLYVAGGEASFKILNRDEYLNTAWGSAGLTSVLVSALPRRSLFGFQLFSEMQSQQGILGQQLNDHAEGVGLELRW